MPRWLIIGLFLIATPTMCAAQSSGEKPQPTPAQPEDRTTQVLILRPGAPVPAALVGAIKPVDLPQGKDAWVVQIVTGGGFLGEGKGDVTVTSSGDVICNPASTPCNKKSEPKLLGALAQLILKVKPENWGQSFPGACSDCYQTVLALHRRDREGVEQVYTISWDDSNQENLPVEVKQIYTNVLKLAAAEKH